MQLTNFKIKSVGNNKLIEFQDLSMENLSLLLNWNYLTIEKIDNALNKLQNIKNNWTDIDNIANNLYGGYWDFQTLADNNVTGDWFTIDQWEDLDVSICKSNQNVYINNDLICAPIVELSLTDLIDILEQWKQIQLLYT